jgi:hypothetical protein
MKCPPDDLAKGPHKFYLISIILIKQVTIYIDVLKPNSQFYLLCDEVTQLFGPYDSLKHTKS